MQGLHIHEPGRLSRWGVVDVGLRCVHSCSFCYYSFLDGSSDQFAGMRKAPFLPLEHLERFASSLRKNGFLGADVTGGEPTLSPHIVKFAEHAAREGLALRIITLGQYLMRKMKSAPGRERLIDALIEAGVADFLLSFHAADELLFEKITGEHLDLLRAAMDHLDGLGFDYGTNTTVVAENFRELPQIAAEIARHRVYIANFIVMNAYYAWSQPGRRTSDVQGHYAEIRPYLIAVRDLLEGHGIAVNVRYAPLCTMKGLERNLVGLVGVRHDPHEWMNNINHMNPGSPEIMGERLRLRDHETHYPLKASRTHPSIIATRGGKIFPEKCRDCRAITVCDGLDARYARQHGTEELQAYAEFRGSLLDKERLAYRAAHVVKIAPHGAARETVRALLQGGEHRDVAAAERESTA